MQREKVQKHDRRKVIWIGPQFLARRAEVLSLDVRGLRYILKVGHDESPTKNSRRCEKADLRRY
jgi:hypothetical protein